MISNYIQLIAVTVFIFLFEARLGLPIISRGLAGNNLVLVLSEFKFKELAVLTFLILTFYTFFKLKLKLKNCFRLSAGAALFNVGLMILDARLQTFAERFEFSISIRYGSKTFILLVGVLCVVIGQIIMFVSLKMSQRIFRH